MKVTIELNDAIINALAITQAEGCALSWYDACTNREVPTTNDKITLYKAAYRDGMQDLFEMIKNMEGKQ